MKPTVYIETTIPSYLTARPSRDVFIATYQHLTREWWETRGEYDLVLSGVVLNECRDGDPQAAADRLAALAGLPSLEPLPVIDDLAAELVRVVRLPPKATSDAYHIAAAAAHGVRYLLTWNCPHLANAALQDRIAETCRQFRFEPPRICTPAQLLGVNEEVG